MHDLATQKTYPGNLSHHSPSLQIALIFGQIAYACQVALFRFNPAFSQLCRHSKLGSDTNLFAGASGRICPAEPVLSCALGLRALRPSSLLFRRRFLMPGIIITKKIYPRRPRTSQELANFLFRSSTYTNRNHPRCRSLASVMAGIARMGSRIALDTSPSTRTSETASAPRFASRRPRAKVAIFTPCFPSVVPT